MAKPEFEFFDVNTIEWTPVAGKATAMSERILAHDLETGVITRLLRFAPGTNTTPNGVLTHDFWEELMILEGSLRDLTLDQVFTKGMYACRPPGMPHGPWETTEGCVTFEVRYYSRK